jgi:hypothetical protein
MIRTLTSNPPQCNCQCSLPHTGPFTLAFPQEYIRENRLDEVCNSPAPFIIMLEELEPPPGLCEDCSYVVVRPPVVLIPS